MEEPKFSVFDEVKLKAELERCGIKHLHAVAIQSYLLAHKDAEPHEVPDLPKAAYPLLRSHFKSTTSKLKVEHFSSDGTTVKLLIEMQNGQSVESVIMRHDATAGLYAGGPRQGSPRATLCVSSQVGCQMGCTFCATGTMGLKGNLSAGEIVEQLVHATRITPIRNIVFMGMGEPLNNYQAVVQAIKTMTGHCFSVSPSHITLSTVGVIPRILSLATDLPGVNLALSLHAPTQELRCQIVPAARAYNLVKLMAAVDSYIGASKRKVFIEYIMIGDVNDSEELAHQVGALLQDRQVVLNLIPYNPTLTKADYKASREESIHSFQKIIREVYNVRAIVRREMGQDIAGACGQLAIGEYKKDSSHPQKASTDLPDIEELFTASVRKP
ncbi:23S rRNA (adenine2503-C2)-methyltransferase [Marchantia polymorpha subsp. ruderalis]|uniref:Radical SAM core domain-containing protein n=2 Tax=Marchantia polymorpha TaxID=3197 RepID=A0A176WMR3_MARPO|nr:hypothetical protein AXG93_4875s1500 [Marchantia polymorpha subsp. ruderalis]PTQ49401.1 hypothetical protein MARPO_0003s0260 [Marchantia polymorpha]BBN17167.1 hypothetical protein Mp_7g12520 [Marchantia polymorpha subsp. ruderalis]|eukprot:PTQ49401.1 hypothetical protein MARPO_0003s0260 [Marchantia polymorpha]